MDDIVAQLASAHASFPLLFWILGSVLAYALATNTLWLAKSRELWRSPLRPPLKQVGRFFFYFSIPYLALGGWPRRPYQGLLSPNNMGMVGLSSQWPVTRWLGAIGTGLGLGVVALLVLTLAWLNANRSSEGMRLRFAPRPVWLILIDVLFLQVHWAFYRGGLAVLSDDVYAGTFLGLGLVYLEWSLNPFWRQGWRVESRAASQWLRAALALISAVIYLLTRNLWICLGIHLLLELAFWQMGRSRLHGPDVPDWQTPREDRTVCLVAVLPD